MPEATLDVRPHPEPWGRIETDEQTIRIRGRVERWILFEQFPTPVYASAADQWGEATIVLRRPYTLATIAIEVEVPGGIVQGEDVVPLTSMIAARIVTPGGLVSVRFWSCRTSAPLLGVGRAFVFRPMDPYLQVSDRFVAAHAVAVGLLTEEDAA